MKHAAYSIVYNDITDPSKKEVNELIKKLKVNNVDIQDKIPGSLLVSGQLSDIEKCLEGNSQWSFSPVVQVNPSTPKHK